MDVNVIGPIISTQAFGPLLGSDPSLKGPKGRIVMISFGGRQERQPADGGLFGIQARDRRTVGKPAPRNDAVRHRRHHHCAGRGEDADLEQGRGSRTFPPTRTRRIFRRWSASANSCMHLGETGLPPEKIAEAIAEALTSANPKVRYQITPGSDAAFDDVAVAQADGRQDHRQAPRPDAAGMSGICARAEARPRFRPAVSGRHCGRSR